MGSSESKPTTTDEAATETSSSSDKIFLDVPAIQEEDDSSDDPAGVKKGVNLLRDGPCAEQYTKMDECLDKKSMRQSVRNGLSSCASEGDLLIKCMRKHPLYFEKKI